MNSKYLAIIAVVAVAAIAVVAISVSQNSDDDGGSDDADRYTFTDTAGFSHSVEVPIENVSVVHKYIPVFLKILGVEDQVGGLDSKYGMTFSRFFENSYNIGSYSEPDGETMLKHDSRVILTPVTMGLSNAEALKEMGIEVIYLDLTDPYVIEDNLKILVKLFGSTETVQSNYEKYMKIFNECGDYAKSFDLSSTSDADFCLYMSSSGFYHTHASAAVKTIEEVSGKSYTHIIDPNVKDTVYFNQAPEVILNFDKEHGLEYLFLYTMDTPEENLQKFLDSGNGIDLSKLSCFTDKHVYALSTDCVNGALCCVSKILYAQTFGADTGTTAEEKITEINEAFGLDYSTENLLVEVSGLV
ncbi:MAG: hypothetical protein LKK03_04845 [Candidatus Methanomethylophilus sp.]|jgi:ABC-type enterochelin transport system substrate-binding protein|nr:hypothetical protein [Methanomethylophilus sp.]MCI2093171.1 hypothetical protein [Methanomethylophilus sp.]MCI2093180.1 hypothetical protein [Methanomethylophilus sp.]